jgi:hypothetical protein
MNEAKLEQLYRKFAILSALKHKHNFNDLPLNQQEEYLFNAELKIRLHLKIFGNLQNLKYT